MDREIRKIAEAIAEKINDISMDETEIIDNGKEIRKLRNIISEKKKILDKIENGEIRKLNMTSINYETERVQGGKRRYRSSIEKLEDMKEKLIHEINMRSSVSLRHSGITKIKKAPFKFEECYKGLLPNSVIKIIA